MKGSILGRRSFLENPVVGVTSICLRLGPVLKCYSHYHSHLHFQIHSLHYLKIRKYYLYLNHCHLQFHSPHQLILLQFKISLFFFSLMPCCTEKYELSHTHDFTYKRFFIDCSQRQPTLPLSMRITTSSLYHNVSIKSMKG